MLYPSVTKQIITLLKNITGHYTADAIAKKKNEECGFRSFVRDYVSGDYVFGGGGEVDDCGNKSNTMI